MRNNPLLNELLQKLAYELGKLPGVGPKTAEKYIFYLLNQNEEEILRLANLIGQLAKNIRLCERCHNFTSVNEALCPICQNTQREQNVICVVARQQDLIAIENLHEYNGLYHVLRGTLNPVEGVTPDKLSINTLLKRLENKTINEIILALDADINGESTILYLQKILKPYEIKITRLAKGMPMGASIEYADEATLANAFKGRKEV
jgi:recombination protein RecR